MSDIKVLGIIPARYASTRLPGKPLALIAGKPMIQVKKEQTNEMFKFFFFFLKREPMKELKKQNH